MPSAQKPQRPLVRAAQTLERFLHGIWRPLTGLVGLRTPRQIVPHRSYGNHEQVCVRGRVLGNRPHAAALVSDGLWSHLTHSRRRWLTFEVPDAAVEVTFEGQSQTVRTDHEGYFEAYFAHPGGELSKTIWWDAVSNMPNTSVHAPHEILVPGENAQRLIISDVDDTVIRTGATQLWTITRLTFFRGVHERRALAGVPELYRKLVGPNADNPLFYVSSSAWNLYEMLTQIMDLCDLPRGPILLQCLGLANNRFVREPGHRHKLHKVEELLATYPELPAILIGDSGQHDARLYVDAVRRNPGRIEAIYIRRVEPEQTTGHPAEIEAAVKEAKALGVPMHVCASTAEMETLLGLA